MNEKKYKLGRARFFLAIVVALVALLPVAVSLASDAKGGSPSIFAGDIGNVVWTLVIFFVVLFILGRFAWGPILSQLQARENFIHDSLAKADEARAAAASQLKEYEQKMAAARAEAAAIVDEGRRDGEVVKQKIESDARAEAEAALERAKREIGIAKETAIKDLYGVAGKLAVGVAGKIIHKELSATDHEQLIADSIAKLESQTPAN